MSEALPRDMPTEAGGEAVMLPGMLGAGSDIEGGIPLMRPGPMLLVGSGATGGKGGACALVELLMSCLRKSNEGTRGIEPRPLLPAGSRPSVGRLVVSCAAGKVGAPEVGCGPEFPAVCSSACAWACACAWPSSWLAAAARLVVDGIRFRNS